MANAEKYAGSNLFVYHPSQANCQKFVQDIIRSNKPIQDTPQLETFVKQDAQALDDSLGLVGRVVSRGLTNLAGRFDHAINGTGIQQRK